MTRKVADVFVVMKGEVPDSIFENNNATTGLEHSTTITSYKKKEAAKINPLKYITVKVSGYDEMAQPWARQSLVQLAPVWGRITDPQTVQTTTSVHSEH